MKKQIWSFTDGKQEIRIRAIDGPTAWKLLAMREGVIQWHGGRELPSPNSWSIRSVCDCGKAQSTRFCSKACYDAAVAND